MSLGAAPGNDALVSPVVLVLVVVPVVPVVLVVAPVLTPGVGVRSESAGAEGMRRWA